MSGKKLWTCFLSATTLGLPDCKATFLFRANFYLPSEFHLSETLSTHEGSDELISYHLISQLEIVPHQHQKSSSPSASIHNP
jgi:hypothetical protein